MPRLLFTTTGLDDVEYDWSWEPARTRVVNRQGVDVRGVRIDAVGKLRSPALAFAAARWQGQFRALYVYGSETPPVGPESRVHMVTYYNTYSILPWGARYMDPADSVKGPGIACIPFSGESITAGMHPVEAFWFTNFYSVYTNPDGVDYIAEDKSMSRTIAELMAHLNPLSMKHFRFL